MSLSILGYEMVCINICRVDVRRPLVEIYNGSEVDLVDDYAPGFREAEEQGNGLAIGYGLGQILANDGNPLTIIDHGIDH